MMSDLHIHWYPGHMAKAHRMIKENLKSVDVVVELLDARIPSSSGNPVIQEVTGQKPRLIVLNKADLADPAMTEEWIRWFKSQGHAALAVNATSGNKGLKNIVQMLQKLVAEKLQRRLDKGMQPRPVRAMILGIPNVGKSSLINALVGSATVRTADKPGVTRGKQWIRLHKDLELLDTPGVLWPRLDNQEAAFRLAVTGAIHDDVYDMEKASLRLLKWMLKRRPEQLVARYNLSLPLPEEPQEVLCLIGARRGCLRSGGVTDETKAAKLILHEFRAGKIGAWTLDTPGEVFASDAEGRAAEIEEQREE